MFERSISEGKGNVNGISSSQHKAVLRDWESGKPAVSHEREPLISEKTRTSVVIGWLLCFGFDISLIYAVGFWPGFSTAITLSK